jgi:transposase-like protein
MPPTDDPSSPKSPRAWSPAEKLKLVAKAEGLSGPELGALLRQEGVHEAQLQEWRRAAEEALSPNAQSKPSPQQAQQAKRLKELERELARKDKALAETAALLVLKKKVEAIWGDEDDSTPEKNEK